MVRASIPNPFCTGKQNPIFTGGIQEPIAGNTCLVNRIKAQEAQPFCQLAQCRFGCKTYVTVVAQP